MGSLKLQHRNEPRPGTMQVKLLVFPRSGASKVILAWETDKVASVA